jgi:hypothetical protein
VQKVLVYNWQRCKANGLLPLKEKIGYVFDHFKNRNPRLYWCKQGRCPGSISKVCGLLKGKIILVVQFSFAYGHKPLKK